MGKNLYRKLSDSFRLWALFSAREIRHAAKVVVCRHTWIDEGYNAKCCYKCGKVKMHKWQQHGKN